MNILFHVPHLNTLYAGRTIYAGYKSAWEAEGHTFRFMTADDSQREVFDDFKPQIFFTSLNAYCLKFLDLSALLSSKKTNKTKVFVNTPFWTSPFGFLRPNEAPSLKDNSAYIKLMQSGNYGDIYFNVSEPEDPRMDGFEKYFGFRHYTIPLAADITRVYPDYNSYYDSDVSYVGTNLPDKRDFFKEMVFPLRESYKLKLYGQDWKLSDRLLGLVQKIGQYFNLPVIKDIRSPSLSLEEERKIYSSTKVCINVHEKYQRNFGGDCNERTFKIPACKGFEVSDNVGCIAKYFKIGEEIVISEGKDDWFDKIHYYINHPEERKAIAERGYNRVISEHTYIHRVKRFVDLYNGVSR